MAGQFGQVAARFLKPCRTPMKAVSRRSFLAATAAAAASPGLGAAAPAPPLVDVAIIGAGAAGVAAARAFAATKRSFALIEASDHIGGRCVTDMQTFGVAYDRGAHWIHMPEINPLAKLAPEAGVDVYPAPPGQRVRIGQRNAREGEMEDFFAALVRSTHAIDEAARGRNDVSCASVLPADLGDWRASIEFMLGPFGCAKALADISAMDFAKSAERDRDAFCRQGFGTALAKLAEGLSVQLSTPVRRIEISRRGIEVQTRKGSLRARTVIVTASTGVLAAGAITFDPELPRRHSEALTKLPLGNYEHIALELPGNPLGLQTDDLVFEKATGQKTAALLANLSGTSLCFVDVAGPFGASLAKSGPDDMVAFAREWLTSLFGADALRGLKRVAATNWAHDPFTRGAFSAALPGGQWARKALQDPVRERLFFAGEAVHETLWGTVGGAWESGTRAAQAAIKHLREE
jgi:monoamine oxidase